jgi:hypothetical protein
LDQRSGAPAVSGTNYPTRRLTHELCAVPSTAKAVKNQFGLNWGCAEVFLALLPRKQPSRSKRSIPRFSYAPCQAIEQLANAFPKPSRCSETRLTPRPQKAPKR